MNPVIYILAATIVAVLLWFVTREGSKNPRANQAQARAGPVERAETVGGVRRRRRDGRGRNQQEVERQREEEVLDESGSEGEALPPAPVAGEGKMGAKKLRKLQEKEERRQMRQEMEIERAERKREQAEKEAMQKKLDELKKIEEEKKAEEEKKIQEEKERKEHEEYLKLKEMFSVDDEGQAAITSEEQSQNLLQEFVQYIKDTKVVLLEDLASHFGMRTQQAIDRVHDMLKDEIITGVIDDRGKFIYISMDELKSVAKFVEQRGRISISELAQASNSLINLKPEKTLTLSKA